MKAKTLNKIIEVMELLSCVDGIVKTDDEFSFADGVDYIENFNRQYDINLFDRKWLVQGKVEDGTIYAVLYRIDGDMMTEIGRMLDFEFTCRR